MEFARVKIVCTIGPASQKVEVLRGMIEAGMDAARINLSHGEYQTHRRVIEALRELGENSIIVDLPGPKIRIGEIEGPLYLKPGSRIHFTTENVVGDLREIPITYPGLPRDLSPGDRLFLKDGLIEVEILSIDEDLKGFRGRIVSGGEVDSHTGVNVPGVSLSIELPTEEDRTGIEFGVGVGADWFAVSFVRNHSDVERVRASIEKEGGDQPLISKIEHRDAIENIDEIIETSDGVMVARGDLGIEIPPWEVPLIQKRIIEMCNDVGKPVIVATEMLKSMVDQSRPTRAEASDVANAVLDGADAVMLSEETAIGLHPVEAVRMMNRILLAVEREARPHEVRVPEEGSSIPDVIGGLVAQAAEVVKPAAIIVVTRSGFSAKMVSKHRPKAKILAISKSRRIQRRLLLYWGVKPLDVEWTEDRDELLIKAVERALEKGLVNREEVIMIVSGSTLEAPGRTSTLAMLRVQDILSRARDLAP